MDIQGDRDEPSGEGSDVNPVYGILLQFSKMELWEAGRGIRELEKGYMSVLTHAMFYRNLKMKVWLRMTSLADNTGMSGL